MRLVPDTLKPQLTRLGYDILKASDGIRVIDQLGNTDLVGLLLVDAVLPGPTRGQALACTALAGRAPIDEAGTDGDGTSWPKYTVILGGGCG